MEALAPERTLTDLDHARLTRLIPGAFQPGGESNDIESLLATARRVAPRAIPADVVTMRSQVVLRYPDGVTKRLTVCYPEDADPSQGRVSVLSPVGSSLLGVRRGESARWRTPIGHEGTARVLEVLYQPEASGDYTA